MRYEKSLFYGALILICLYLSPYYLLRGNAHVRIHDNLDSNIIWYKLMADTHTLFGNPHSIVPNIMNGLPRNSLGSEFDIYVLMFSFLSPFTAYITNQTIMRFVAFFGMFFLLKHHTLKPYSQFFPIIIGVSLCYAWLPYWPSMGLSIAGLPLALYAFMTIKNNQTKLWHWLIIGLLPFYSSFILSFIFFIACLGIWWVFDSIKNKRFHVKWLVAMTVMTLLYLIVNYRIIDEMFLQMHFISHREAFDRGHLTSEDLQRRALYYFTVGQTHVLRLTEFIVLPIIMYVLMVTTIRLKPAPLLWLLMLLNGLFCSIIAFYYSEILWQFQHHFRLIGTFNFGRIHFLEPLLWYVAFALALSFIYKTYKNGKHFVYVFLLLQLTILLSYSEENKYTFFGAPTYNQFYSTELFHEIQRYIGQDPSTYRVASIGLHPSIAQYNDFYTLDGYVASYPLSYKKQFRQIIAPELKKRPSLRRYYDHWGSRCYLFVAELGKHYMYTKTSHKQIHHLAINTAAFKKMGGHYIFSAVKIDNPSDNHLALERTFENKQSLWRIYLYKVAL